MKSFKINASLLSNPVKVLKSVATKSDNRLTITVNKDSLVLKTQGSPTYGEYILSMTNNEPFEFIVNHMFFNEILSKVSSEEIEISLTDENKVSILDGDTKFEIPVIDGKIYPPNMGTLKMSKTFTPEIWMKMQNYLMFATSSDDNRPIFTGVGVKTEGNSLMMYATNAHIMSKFVVDTSVNDLPDLTVLPKEVFVAKPEKDINLSILGTFAKVSYDGFTFVTPMLQGNPPDYERVMPQTSMELILNKNILLQEVRKLLICSSTKEITPVQVYFRKDKVELFTENQELGKVRGSFVATIPADFVGQRIAFNGQYLADLSHFEADEIKLATIAQGENGISLSPIIFSSATETFKFVMTPIRVKTWSLDE